MKVAILICALFVAGCKSTGASSQKAMQDPFELTLVKKARWSPGHKGYDPDLPGYRIVGDIASITLKPRTKKIPKKLVLVIQTSPGMPPMLENFTLAAPEITITTALPNHQKIAEIRHPKSPKPWETAEQVPKDTYFHFAVIGDRVHVILLPKAMKLLTDQCKISWIDWYR